MTPKSPLRDLCAGDALIYSGTSLFDWVIRFKTFSKACHIELAFFDEISLASRNGKGVNMYPLRTEGLIAVLRPKKEPLDFETGLKWFNKEARGQEYGWLSLLNFYLIRLRDGKRMFCSEFATLFYARCGFQPFQIGYPAYKVPPSLFLISPEFNVIWSKK